MLEVEGDTSLIAHHPGVVARLRLEGVSRSNQYFLAISPPDHHLADEYVSDVGLRVLSSLRAGVFGPSPARPVLSPANGGRCQNRHRSLAPVSEFSLVRHVLEILCYDICHENFPATDEFTEYEDFWTAITRR